jgi:hypothetical protein
MVCRCINWREGKCCLAGGIPPTQTENVQLSMTTLPTEQELYEASERVTAIIEGIQRPLMERHEAQLNALYAERNALAIAFATAMQALGYRAGYGLDQDADADWPVLYVSTPAGQVSWHIPKAEAAHSRIALGVYGQPWDGHTTALKYQRLASLNPYTLRTADLRHGVRTRTDAG